jgi:hypothetical protein
VYNARKTLYPKRSKKYIIADVEYLLIDPDFADSPESINEYIDLITGFPLKEDTISGNALYTIEKFLLSEYKHNKLKQKRRNKQ